MLLLFIIIIILYLGLIGSFVIGCDKVENFELKNLTPKTTFSIVIPFRNESKNLPDLLDSIKALNYPKSRFEVILIDDGSNDGSKSIISKYLSKNKTDIAIAILDNERFTDSPKKDSITLGISEAKYKWILTTDADCTLPKYWLDSFDEYIQENASSMIVGPVCYTPPNNFLERFQCLDVLCLQAATMGGFGINKPFLCNGANLAYKKELFIKLNGFKGNSSIASGDDVFLLEKAVNVYKENVHYLKSEHAIVKTKPEPSWSSLIEQRIRWTSKTTAYKNTFGKLTGLIVFLTNVLLVTGILFVFFGVLSINSLIYIVFIKFNIDLLLLYKSASFFKQKSLLISYLISFVVYPFFSSYVAIVSMFSKYKWKGRFYSK